jgi:predicted component of type VI protein secretion system
MPPQLLALTDGQNILLDKPIMLLGRHQECDIQLVSRKVSRRHCCIAQVGSQLVVRDLGSTNGIRINGVRVLEGTLKPGDELTIGNYRYEVRAEALVESPPVRPSRNTALRHESAPSARPAAPPEDELLESCEEPIPLAEPAGKPRNKIGNRPTKLDPHNDLPSLDESQTAGPGARDGRSLILPDQIELAPVSDVVPSSPPPPPPQQ